MKEGSEVWGKLRKRNSSTSGNAWNVLWKYHIGPVQVVKEGRSWPSRETLDRRGMLNGLLTIQYCLFITKQKKIYLLSFYFLLSSFFSSSYILSFVHSFFPFHLPFSSYSFSFLPSLTSFPPSFLKSIGPYTIRQQRSWNSTTFMTINVFSILKLILLIKSLFHTSILMCSK